MRRLLPWALLVVAVALCVLLGWHFLGADEGGAGLEGELGAALGADEVAAPSLVGAPGARPPPSRPTGPLRILGEVVDDEGRPLAGVPVVARLTPWERDAKARIRRSIGQLEAPPTPATVAEAVSGADGTFTMHVAEVARYRVEARVLPPKRSSSPHAFFFGQIDEQRVTLRVREGSTLRGRVLGADDAPLAAILTATAYHPPQWTGVADPVATNPADGRFSIPALTPGRWNVVLVLPGRVRLTGFVVEMPRDEEWTIRLGGEAGAIVGTVTGRADAPVAGANVLVRTRDENRGTSAQVRGVTGADGTYAIDAVPAGTVAALSVLHDDYVALSESPPLARWSGAEVEAGEEVRLDVALQAGATVSGRVIDEVTKAPLAGVQVFVAGPQDAAGLLPPATTGPDGRYRIAGVGPGRHVLLARHATHYLSALETRRVRTVKRGPYETSSVELVPPALALVIRAEDREVERDVSMRRGFTVSGRVLGPGDAPVEGARVVAWNFGVQQDASRFGAQAPPDESTPARSAADGSFTLEGLPPRDDWIFVAQKKPLVAVPSAKTAVTEDDASPLELTLRLEEGAVLAGALVGPDGQGLVANLYAYPKGPWMPGRTYGSAASRADGSFTMEGVPAGDVTLRAWTQRQGAASLEVEGLQAGERREGIRLAIAAGVRLSGQLVDIDGKPVANRHLELSTPTGSGSSSSTQTDDAGNFVFENAPEGEVRFRTYHMQDGFGQPVAVGKAVAPAEDVRLTLPPEQKTVLEGQIVGPGGQPVPLCRVVVSAGRRGAPSYGGSSARAFQEVVVGGQFRREVHGLPPYLVRVSEARDHEGEPLNLKPAETSFSEGETILIRLEEGLEVEGKVVDETGAGLADVHVYNAAGDAWSDAEGRFTLAGFTGPSDVLNVQVPAGFVTQPPIPVGEGRTEIRIELQSAISVSGVVLTDDGQLEPGRTCPRSGRTATRLPAGCSRRRMREDGSRSKAFPPTRA